MKSQHFHTHGYLNNNGITLIALVITIIVLLILAGVVIITLTDNNGILQKSTTAKQNTEEATELESIKLAVFAAQTEGEGTITTENLNKELNDIAKPIENNWYYKGYIIFEDGNVEKYDKLLPVEYHQVEYIESSGKQYIATNIVSSKSIFEYSAEVSATQSTGTGQQILFGSTNGFNVTIISKIYRATSRCITNIPISLDKFDKINLVSNPITSRLNLTINDVTKTGEYTSFVMNEKIGIFAFANGVCKAKCKLKNLKISINGEEKANFIPCYSVTTVTDSNNKTCSSGTIGMYDTVTEQFYVNQGTGKFGYGMEDGTYVAPQ